MPRAYLHQRPAACTGARALYLGARDRKQVSCTEEALVVRNDKAQTLRYPVSRVARVVSSAQVDWSGAALALCLRRGIGITWLARVCLPYVPVSRERTSGLLTATVRQRMGQERQRG